MKKKIIVFFSIIGLLILSIVNYIIPVKAVSDLNADFYNDEYFIISMYKYDYDTYYRPNRMKLFEINIPHYYGAIDGDTNQFNIYNVKMTSYIEEYTQNNHKYRIIFEYEAPESGAISGVFLTRIIYIDNEMTNYLIFCYNRLNTQNNLYLLYYGIFEVKNDLFNNLVSSYFDFIEEGGANIIFSVRQFVGNDYYSGSDIDGLFVSIDQYYSYSPFRVIARNNYNNGYNSGIAENLSSSWLSDMFNSISNFLAIQVFPGFQIGYLLSIPIVFGILRMILHIWKN